MKTVKIILYALIVITLVFFGTGLIVKENQYEIEISIDKPISETFQFFNDLSSVKEWIPEFQSIDTISEKPGRVGSEYRISVDNKGQTVAMKERILAYVENKKVTLYFDAEGVFKTDDYSFAAVGNATKITLRSSFQAKSYILSCIFPYFKGTFKGIDLKNLNNFKTFVETQ